MIVMNTCKTLQLRYVIISNSKIIYFYFFYGVSLINNNYYEPRDDTMSCHIARAIQCLIRVKDKFNVWIHLIGFLRGKWGVARIVIWFYPTFLHNLWGWSYVNSYPNWCSILLPKNALWSTTLKMSHFRKKNWKYDT